jgi:sec-independent protein translocase protein TatC
MAENQAEMSIWDHLEELRRRLLIAIIAMVVTTGFSFLFTNNFISVLAKPMPGGLEGLQAIQVQENIGVFMRVALLGGVILGMPVIVYELLMFILPGLTNKEKRWIYMAVPAATLLFIAGLCFTYYIMLPRAIPFLINFLGVQTKPTLSSYIEFVTNFMFWIGISFETPLLIFVLAKFKIVSASMLIKFWRYAVIIIALLAAVVTPTVDPVNMSLFMLPLMVLYGISIILAFFARR